MQTNSTIVTTLPANRMTIAVPKWNIVSINPCAAKFSHSQNPLLTSKQKEFLQKFDSNWEYNDDSDTEAEEQSSNLNEEETKQEFENKKRQLLLLLDQAQLSKMK